MEIKKPINKKILKILALVVSICLVLSFVIRYAFGTINEYIAELGIVYVPQKPAIRFYYQIFSIDIFEYWVFKLSNEEEKIILDEAENGNWSEMNSEHIAKLEYFDEYKKIFGNRYKKHKCYICIYDKSHKEIISDSDNEIWQDTTKWIIFLYDVDSNRYYCVFETV